MPALKLTDNFGLVLDAKLNAGSAFTKYLKSPGALIGMLRNLKPIKDLRISDDPLQSQSIGIAFTEPIALGNTGVELTIKPSLTGTISIAKGESLFDAESDIFRESLPIPAQHAYLAAALNAEVDTAIADKVTDLQFGFAAGTRIVITNYRLRGLSDPIVPELERLFTDFTLPGDLEDVEHLSEHDVLTVEGTGSLVFTAKANVLAAANPLATLNAPFVPIKVSEGNGVLITGTYTLTGNYQIRIERLSARRFRLGYHKKRTSEFGVSVQAQVVTNVTAGGFDLVKSILQAVSSDPVPDRDVFQQAGLSDEKIRTITAALKTGIERSIALSLAGDLDSLDSSSTAFSYEIDADLLDESGRTALHNALDGDLTGLEAAEHPGITRRKSIFESLRQGKRVLRVNLLGIFNHVSITTLFQKGTIIVDRDTGDITITDQAGANRIEFSDNFARDSAKLRRVLAESLLITAAYRCTSAFTAGPLLDSHYWFFALQQKTNFQQMSDYLNIAGALQLLSPDRRTAKLTSIRDITAFGRSTLFIDAAYSDALCKRMFLDRAGQPRTEEEYEKIGRTALLLLLPPDGAISNARRLPLTDDVTWNKMKNLGQAALPTFLASRGLNANQIADITSDYTLIRWWAGSMHDMGKALVAILSFIAANHTLDRENNTFKQLRNKLESAMASVVSNTHAQFSEPWGILALDLASDQQSATSLQLVSPRTTIVLTERAAQRAKEQED